MSLALRRLVGALFCGARSTQDVSDNDVPAEREGDNNRDRDRGGREGGRE